jgi:hypothetical protein
MFLYTHFAIERSARNLLYIIMAAAVQGRVGWLREDEKDRQGVSFLNPTLFCRVIL